MLHGHATWAAVVSKFLIILPLSLHFVSPVQWDDEVCVQAEETRVPCVPAAASFVDGFGNAGYGASIVP